MIRPIATFLPQFRSNFVAIWIGAAPSMPFLTLLDTLRTVLRAADAGLRRILEEANGLETIAMIFGLGGLALALGVTVAEATLDPVVITEEELRRAVVAADFDDAICPDGWAADHARLLDRTEAEIKAWYLREALELEDDEVILGVALYLARAKDFREIAGSALTRNQILLCIAEGRRLTTPLDELVPPSLRS